MKLQGEKLGRKIEKNIKIEMKNDKGPKGPKGPKKPKGLPSDKE